MKGITLPVELLIILIVAVVVLLAVILFYYGGWRGTQTIDIQTALNRACNVVVTNFCSDAAYDKTVKGVDFNRDGRDDTVEEICKAANLLSQKDCFKRCGCGV
jgi:hypothetical protein